MTAPRPPRPEATKLKLTIAGDEWTFDPDDIDLAGAFAIKAAAGYTLNGLMRALEDGDPLAIQCVIWFCRRQAGETGLQMETINFKFRDIDIRVVEATPPVEAPSLSDPESTGLPSETATSASSPTSATSPPTISTD